MCTPQPLSEAQRSAFVQDGFVIIPGAVPQKNVREARQFIQTAYDNKQYNVNGISKPGSRKPAPGFYKPVQAAKEVMDLLYESNLHAAAEQILGKGHVKIRNNHGQIAYTAPSENFINQGMDIHQPHPKRRWHIDAGHGKYAAVGSDFSLLIGVCLSDGQYIDENRGQFNVWPGSHLITHPALWKVIKTTPANNVMDMFMKPSPDVGTPRRTLLRPGDGFIAHQRLAHAAGFNLSNITRVNVYFRAIDTRLDYLLHDFVRSPTPWVGFDGLKDLVPHGATEFDENAAKRKGKYEICASSSSEDSDNYVLSDEQKRFFIQNGYVVLPNAVSNSLTDAALEIVDPAFANGEYHMNGKKRLGSKDPPPVFLRKVKKRMELRDLFFKSGLVNASEQLIGKGRVTLRENLAEISFILPSDEFIAQGMGMNETYPKRQWKLDPPMPDYKGLGADYNFFVGIALSDGHDVDENRGQLCVWPGSHIATHRTMSEVLKEESPSPNVLPAFRKRKPIVGNPKRVLMKRGDAVIVHQRTAIAPGINLANCIRKTVSFRVIHPEFDHVLEEYSHAPHPFVGFEGIREMVQNSLP